MAELIELRRGQAVAGSRREQTLAPCEPRVRWLDSDTLEAIDQRAEALASVYFRQYRRLMRELVIWRRLEPEDVVNWRPGSDE